MNTPLLDVENLSVSINTATGPIRAVQDVSFQVAKGETFCLVGESGCGKSITALSLMGLMPKRAQRMVGRMLFDGSDISQLREREMRHLRGNRISMIFQEPMTSLNPVFTIGKQLFDVLGSHRRVSEAEAKERAMFLLDKVGITNAKERLKQYPHELSGGLRQRVMIAMALMCNPDLMIADEPTTALDVTIQAELLRLLRDLQSEFQMGLLLITHDLGIVSRIANKIAIMYAGQIVEYGTAEQIFNSPLHPYTQGLISCIPSRDHPRMQHLPSIPGTVPTLIGDMQGCHFRQRCRYETAPCRNDIELASRGASHAYRCILEPSQAAANAKQREVDYV